MAGPSSSPAPRDRTGSQGGRRACAPGKQQAGGTSDHEVVLVRGAEGSCSQNVQTVHQDQGPREVFPALGDGVLHPVQARVQLLDDIAVAVPDLVAPGQQEVIRGFPHGLDGEGAPNGRRESRRRLGDSEGVDPIITCSGFSAHHVCSASKSEVDPEKQVGARGPRARRRGRRVPGRGLGVQEAASAHTAAVDAPAPRVTRPAAPPPPLPRALTVPSPRGASCFPGVRTLNATSGNERGDKGSVQDPAGTGAEPTAEAPAPCDSA